MSASLSCVGDVDHYSHIFMCICMYVYIYVLVYVFRESNELYARGALLTKEMNDGRLAMLAVAYFALVEKFAKDRARSLNTKLAMTRRCEKKRTLDTIPTSRSAILNTMRTTSR
jgi:hypothetical protein